LDASGTPIVPPTPAPLREFGPNVINIVLLGSDRRPGDTAWRTDVVILVSVDPDVPSITMLSFPRDLWVYIPGWRWQRINLADGRGQVSGFPGGGPALVKQTIQYNFGIPVQYYARVDFGGYKELIDSVGGVEVIADCSLYDIFPDVPDGQTDIITGVDLTTVPTGTIDIPIAGVYHLDGKHALWYARSRKTTSDFDRSRRQQRVLRGVWNAVREQGLIGQLPQLWDSVTQSVETDLTLNDVIYLANVGLRVDPAHIRSRFVDGSMLMWHVTETGASVLRYNYKTIAPYLDETFAPMPKNIASQAPAWVDVLNGTAHADWDRVAADRLGWDGFTVLSWGKADTLYDHTTLIDYTTTQKGSRLSALADLFGVAPDNVLKQPDRNSPVAYRVIVGADFEPCQRPSRGQWPTPVPSATPTTIP
jgi:LCP family protein required for cell wall assembly